MRTKVKGASPDEGVVSRLRNGRGTPSRSRLGAFAVSRGDGAAVMRPLRRPGLLDRQDQAGSIAVRLGVERLHDLVKLDRGQRGTDIDFLGQLRPRRPHEIRRAAFNDDASAQRRRVGGVRKTARARSSALDKLAAELEPAPDRHDCLKRPKPIRRLSAKAAFHAATTSASSCSAMFSSAIRICCLPLFSASPSFPR